MIEYQRRQPHEIYYPLLNLTTVREPAQERKDSSLAQSDKKAAPIYSEIAMSDYLEAMEKVNQDLSEDQKNYLKS